MKNMNALLALTLTLAACGSGTLLIEEDTWVEDTEIEDTEIEDTGCPDRIWYEDADGDGFVNPDTQQAGCDRPGARWLVQQDIKGYWSGETHLYWDCDDTNPNVYPGATEVCDGVDNNCNGLTDEEDPSLDEETLAWFGVDADEDKHWDGIEPWQACPVEDPVPGVVALEKDPRGNFPEPDCDDEDPAFYPGAPDGFESEDGFNGKDNSCNDRPDNLRLSITPRIVILQVGYGHEHTTGIMDTLTIAYPSGEEHTFDFEPHGSSEDEVFLLGVDRLGPDVLEGATIIIRSLTYDTCYAMGVEAESTGCYQTLDPDLPT